MASLLSTESLARTSARRPWVVIAVWVLALVAFIALAATFLTDALIFEFKLDLFVKTPRQPGARWG